MKPCFPCTPSGMNKFTPLGSFGNQTLLDLAEPTLQKLAAKSPSSSRVMVASGDVLILTPNQLPEVPQADVVFFGLWVTPVTASNFGVMFCRRENPENLVTLPSETIYRPDPGDVP